MRRHPHALLQRQCSSAGLPYDPSLLRSCQCGGALPSNLPEPWQEGNEGGNHRGKPYVIPTTREAPHRELTNLEPRPGRRASTGLDGFPPAAMSANAALVSENVAAASGRARRGGRCSTGSGAESQHCSGGSSSSAYLMSDQGTNKIEDWKTKRGYPRHPHGSGR